MHLSKDVDIIQHNALHFMDTAASYLTQLSPSVFATYRLSFPPPQVVVAQWRWFARERLALLAALRHWERRTCHGVLGALSENVAQQRLLSRQAAIYDSRRLYLLLSRCAQTCQHLVVVVFHLRVVVSCCKGE